MSFKPYTEKIKIRIKMKRNTGIVYAIIGALYVCGAKKNGSGS